MRTLTGNEIQAVSGGLELIIGGCYTAQQWRDMSDQVSYEATRAGIIFGGIAAAFTGMALTKYVGYSAGIAGAIGAAILVGPVAYVKESRNSEIWPWNQ